MEMTSKNNVNNDLGRIISTFDVGELGKSYSNYNKGIIESDADNISFTDGINESMDIIELTEGEENNEDIEEIELLKDVDTNNKVNKKSSTKKKSTTAKSSIANNRKINGEIDEIIDIKNDMTNTKDNEEDFNGKNFKAYIKLCISMGLIPYWGGFEKFNKL